MPAYLIESIRPGGRGERGGTSSPLGHDSVRDAEPPRRGAAPYLDDEVLRNHQQGQRNQIHLVDAPVHKKISHNTEQNDPIQTRVEEVAVKKRADAAKGCVKEHACSNEDEAAMELRLPAPQDGEAETQAEGEHVRKRDDEKSILAGQMELVGVESGHDDTGGTADQDHGRPERGAEPAEGTMPAHVARTHEGGLQDKEYEPAGKDGGMKIQNDGTRNGGMEQVSVDGKAEAPHNNGGDEQRHGEIEI